MRLKSTKFSGLKLIKTKIYRDSRGFFKEDFKQKLFKKSKFIFGCTSSSKKNVFSYPGWILLISSYVS